MKLVVKLQASHLLMAVIPVIVAGLVTLALTKHSFAEIDRVAQDEAVGVLIAEAEQALVTKAEDRLQVINDLKALTLTQFFERTEEQLQSLTLNPVIREAADKMSGAFERAGGVEGGEVRGLGNYGYQSPVLYRVVHDQFQPSIDRLLKLYDYYDIFLLDAEQGALFYTVFKEDDLGRLVTGDVIGGGFAEVWQAAVDGEMTISDMQRYAPSAGAPAIFAASPLRGRDGSVQSVVAIQLNTAALDAVVNDRSGLGVSGSSYVVGTDSGGATTLRSTRVWPEDQAMPMGSPKAGQFVDRALRGESGVGHKVGPTGERELIAYRPFDYSGHRWALITTISEQEALAAVGRMQEQGDKATGLIADVGDEAAASARMTLLIITVIVVAAGLLIAYLVARSLATAVGRASSMAADVAAGKLDQRIASGRVDEIGDLEQALDVMAETLQQRAVIAGHIAEGDLRGEVTPASSDDQFGTALVHMTDGLNRNVAGVRAVSQQVGAGSRQVADASQALSQGATEQAASLEEVASALTQLAAQTKQNADNATAAAEMSGTMRNQATEGGQDMLEMVSAMGEIQDASEQIGAIIKVIDDIAFQTNLLALNAAVEAARAGRHGKGFAVVADEVRSLAGRSAKAARETATLIDGAADRVARGVGIANTTQQSFGDMLTMVSSATDLIEEIAASSNEQAQGIDQIHQGIDQIDGATQQAAASAEETASTAAELTSQAQQLEQLVARFQLRASATAEFNDAAFIVDEVPFTDANHDLDAQPEPETTPGVQGVITSDQEVQLDDDEFGRY